MIVAEKTLKLGHAICLNGEAKILQLLSGRKNFLLLFCMTGKSIITEFVGQPLTLESGTSFRKLIDANKHF